MLGLAEAADGIIWIRTELDLDTMLRVAAHEMRHMIQSGPADGCDPMATWERNEHEADEYEDIFLRRFGAVLYPTRSAAGLSGRTNAGATR